GPPALDPHRALGRLPLLARRLNRSDLPKLFRTSCGLLARIASTLSAMGEKMRIRLGPIAGALAVLAAGALKAQEPTPTPGPTPTPTPPAVRFYGWVQQGFTANFDSPKDRVNFGVNFNWRSNDYRLNQVYFILDNLLEHEAAFNVGYRADFLVGHDAPFL